MIGPPMSIIYRVQFVAVMNAAVLLVFILGNFFVPGILDFWTSSTLFEVIVSLIAWFAAPLGYRLLDEKVAARRRQQ
jgi:hypothetical protein